jgi:peptidyl-prolyl cis-trans isomerase D
MIRAFSPRITETPRMLHVFRKASQGWIFKGLMGLLVLSFIVWGIADVFRNFTDTAPAQIGDVKLSPESFRQAYTERMREMGRQLGRALTPDQARAMGLDRQILSEMFSEAALDQKAKKLGLNVGDETLVRKIEKMPEFAGPSGFSHEYFLLVLRSNQMSEAQYIDNERRLMLRQQINRGLAGDIAVPKVMSEALRRYQTEERAVDFVTLGRSEAGAIPAPTPEQLKAFYDERKPLFRAPEYRKLQMIVLTPDTVAASMIVSDADLEKIYESRKDRFTTPERRAVDQIVFQSPEEAAAASARLASGLSFDALLQERKLSPKDVSLGTVTKREILDPAVANATFALASGQVSAPVAGRFGNVIVRVSKIEPSVGQAFSAVAADLRKEATTERARKEILDLHDKIEDERASGSTIPEVANKLKLPVVTLDAVDRSGRKPDGTRVEGIPANPELIAAAFASRPGADNDTIDLRNQGGYVWYDVAAITPSRERTFDEVKAEVETRWKDEEAGKKLVTLADAARTKLDSGQTFAQALPGVAVSHRDKLQRARGAEGFSAASINRIFETADGKAGILEAPDGVGRIVYRVTSASVPPAPPGAEKIDEALARGMQDDVLTQYIQRVQNELGVKVNEAAIRSITGADRN